MDFLNKIPSTVQGTLLIIAGILILFNSLGFVTQIIRIIVICGAIGLIVWGTIKAEIVGKISRLLKKDNNQPKPPLQ